MMSGVPLETGSAFNKLWNNKFYYKFASVWLFLLIHTAMYGSIHIKYPAKFFLELVIFQTNLWEMDSFPTQT